MGASFTLEWRAGPAAAVTIRTLSPSSGRWIATVLSAAYGGGAWSCARRPEHPEFVGPRRLFGVREGPLGAVLPDHDPLPWCEAVLAALPTFRLGLTLSWRLQPAGLPRPSSVTPAPSAPTYLPPGFRAPPATEVYLAQQDRRERERRLPRWIAHIWLEAGESAYRSGEVARFTRLLASASTRPGSARLAFHPPRTLGWPTPSAVPLCEGEVAGLFPSPGCRFLPGGAGAQTSSASLALGTDGAGVRVAIPIEAGQGRHAVILGETGMGKSTLLIGMALAAAHQGNVVLFDPIGDTGRDFLARLPTERYDETVWISPARSPRSIDLLEPLRARDRSEAQRDRATGDLVTALRRVRAGRYTDATFWGPRIEETLRRVLTATAAVPGSSLADAVDLLSIGGRRAVGIPPEAQAAVESLLARVRERPDEVDGTRRLLGEITDRPILRQLLGDRAARLRVRDMFLPGRITVVSGDAAAIGESAARYLLAVHLALGWSERQATPGAPKTFVFLDEAQWYAHEAVAEILRLGRRENLHLVLATQGLAALSEEVREAVRTNAADVIAFRGSPEDARELARMAPWVSADRWTALPRGHAIALVGKGTQLHELRRPPLPPWPAGEPESRLSRLAEATAPGAGPGGEGHGEPGSASVGGADIDPAMAAMLRAIGGECLAAPGASEVEVAVDGLRLGFDPAGESVRRLGGVLRQRGALLRVVRDSAGHRWVVAPGAIARVLGGGIDPHDLEDARRRYRAALPRSG